MSKSKGKRDLFEEREIVKSLALQLRDAATGFAAATQSSLETWSIWRSVWNDADYW